MKKFTLEDIERLLVLKTWYASIFVLPLSNRLSLYIANHTNIKPNQITITGFIFRIIAGFIFLSGSYPTIAMGALFYYISYIFDCTDGPVARLTKKTSSFGRYLDHACDLVGDIWVLSSLFFKVYNSFIEPMFISMLFMHIAESYISYLTGFAIRASKSHNYFKFSAIEKFNLYRKWWFRKNYKSFLSFPDYTAFLFILAPLTNKVELGFKIGFYLLFVIVCYTVLSTFVSIQTNEEKFP